MVLSMGKESLVLGLQEKGVDLEGLEELQADSIVLLSLSASSPSFIAVLS